MSLGDTAYDTTYMNNSGRYDSTPKWMTATGFGVTQNSSPTEGSAYFDPSDSTLKVYDKGAWTVITGGGGGGGGVTSVNGKTGSVTLNISGVPQVVVTKTSNYTITTSDDIVLADATSAAFNLTLPTAVGFTGMLILAATTSGTNLVTVKTSASQTISGGSTVVLGTIAGGAPYQTVALISDNSNWWIV